MSKKPTTALGAITTPYGDVLIRVERHARTGRPGFVCRGLCQALRWLFPGRTVADGKSKLYLLPPASVSNATDMVRLFEQMREESTRRPQAPMATSGSGTTVDAILDLIKVEVKSSLRASTVETYQHEWKGLLSHIAGNTRLHDITRETVQSMIADKIEEGLSPATIRKHLIQLNRIMTRAMDEGLITRNPCLKIRMPRMVKRAARFLTDSQRQRLLEASKKRGRDSFLLVACGIYLGLRKAELLSMRWEQIDLDKRLAYVKNQKHFRTKSGKERSVPICDALAEILLPFHAGKGLVLKPGQPYDTEDERRYRWDFRTLLSLCCMDAGIDPIEVSPHVLRHTFASIAAQNNVSLYKIAVWMGHSQVEVTQLYAHLVPGDDEINKLNPSSAPAQRAALRIVE
jgi:site-specific recombinase XerD